MLRAIRVPRSAVAAVGGCVRCAGRTLLIGSRRGVRLDELRRGSRVRRFTTTTTASSSSQPTTSSSSSQPSSTSSVNNDLSAAVLAALRSVQHAHTARRGDLVSLGAVQVHATTDGVVTIELQLDEYFRENKKQCVAAAAAVPGVRSVQVKMSAPAGASSSATAQASPPSGKRPAADGLAAVKHIVAVSSCKGGVGKSTVAVNLAFALAAAGHKVGIFDADIFGPSLPTLVTPTEVNAGVYQNENGLIEPLSADGIRLMSYGYVLQQQQRPAAVMRGPMVAGVVQQLVTRTDWGELDYLVVDLPPGNGDVQITLTQTLRIRGAVVVTTPQKLSFVDVVKGIEMFNKVRVPVMAVVENMAYFTCDGCQKEHLPFGPGYGRAVATQFHVPHYVRVPLVGTIAAMSDHGTPFVLDNAPHTAPVRALYHELARITIQQCDTLASAAGRDDVRPNVWYDEDRRALMVLMEDKAEHAIPAQRLRQECRCAACVDESTGERTLRVERVRDDITIKQVSRMGNYAVSVHFSDGHTSSVYPYERLRELARETPPVAPPASHTHTHDS